MLFGGMSRRKAGAGPAARRAGQHSLPDPPVFEDEGRRADFFEVRNRAAGKHTPRPVNRRRRNERRGRAAEWLAAAILVLKGYRIVARRARTPYGELDVIAVRGRRLAFVEVKYRDTLHLAARAVSRGQAIRMARAAEHWAGARPAYRGYRLGLDGLYLAPWCLPRHRIDGLQPL